MERVNSYNPGARTGHSYDLEMLIYAEMLTLYHIAKLGFT